MSKYKFKIGKEELRDELVNKHKDFARLLNNYEQATKPLYKSPLYFYKNRKVWLVILLIILMIVLLSEI